MRAPPIRISRRGMSDPQFTHSRVSQLSKLGSHVGAHAHAHTIDMLHLATYLGMLKRIMLPSPPSRVSYLLQTPRSTVR